MASLTARRTRFDLPGEPGAWVELRRLADRELEERPELAWARHDDWSRAQWSAYCELWIQACLVAWSFDEPATIEVVRELLDWPTKEWIATTAFRHTYGMETVTEKNAGSPGSTATSTESPAPAIPTSTLGS